MAGGDDEVRLSASLQDDISAALAKIEQRIKSLEDSVDKLGRAGAKGGEEFAAGVDKAARSADNMGDQARQAKKPVDDLGDAAAKTGAKSAVGSKGLDEFAKKADKAGKKAGGLGTIMTALKFSAIISGAFALAGGVSAIGAGAVIAVGGLGSLTPAMMAALPLFAAAKVSMLAWKLAATQLEQPLTRIKNQFTELGPVIARGGLLQGVDYLANSVGKLAKASGQGLAVIGGYIGGAARYAGDIAKSAPFLLQVRIILASLGPIVRDVSLALIDVIRTLLNFTQAAYPAAQDAAEIFRQMAAYVRDWSAAQLENGNLTNWITTAWNNFKRTIGVVVDILIGLFNIFRIGAGYAGDMGLAIEGAARRFREWTGSAEGQAAINRYFQDSLPALREMTLLIGALLKGFATLGTSVNVAPLLNQLRTELLPAIMLLVQNLSGQNGLGPAVIDVATNLVRMFAGLDFSGLTLFVQAIGKVLEAIVWLQQNVPGANLLISGLLASFLGFKLLGPVWTMVAGGAKAFSWIGVATKGVGELSLAQKLLGPAFRGVVGLFSQLGAVIGTYVIPAIRGIAIAGVGALRTLGVALLTTPVGWIILAIMAVIGVILLLWFKCAWFRDAMIAVWNAIKTAALAVWNAIKTAFWAVVNAFVAAWNWVVGVFTAIINTIVDIAMWIWDHGLKQVLSIVVAAFEIYFNIIKFIVQTAIYIIVGLITLIAIAAKFVWDLIAAGAEWLWNTVIRPIWELIKNAALVAWMLIQQGAQTTWNFIAGIVNWFWTTILQPILMLVQTVATAVWTGISIAAQWAWGLITSAVSTFWGWVSPIFSMIGGAGSAVWNVIKDAASVAWMIIQGGWQRFADFMGGVWNGVKTAGTAVWDAIKGAATSVADAVKGAWNAVVGVIKGAWNAVAGVWNGIPSFTVPDWIPGLGGKTFSLPKLPTLWHGGPTPPGAALVGEHGPEPLVRGGRMVGMVGQNGPEIANLPSGGYVVPNLRTLARLPGLSKTIPDDVATAVATSVPGYAGALGPPRASGDGSGALAREVGNLASAVANQLPSVSVSGGGDVYQQVLDAYHQIRREQHASGKYHYG